jgi:hypothetical protein
MLLYCVIFALFLSGSKEAPIFSPSVQAEKPVVKKEAANNTRTESESKKRDGLSNGGLSSSTERKPNGQAEREKHDAQPDERTYKVEIVSQPRDALFVIYVVLTGLALVVSGATFGMVYRQTKSLRTIERAWIIGVPELGKLEKPSERGDLITLPVAFKNVGKTPAKIIEAGVSLKTTDTFENISPQPTFRSSERITLGALLLTPQDFFYLTTPKIMLTQIQYNAIRDRKLFLYCYGFARYEDAFGTKRESKFCQYYLVSDEIKAEGFQRCLDAPSRYHEAT